MQPAPALLDIQASIRDRLDVVPAEMWRIVRADAPIIDSVNAHLTSMKGKMFRPTVLLLVDLAPGHARLGGSTLAQVFCQAGNEAPDVD